MASYTDSSINFDPYVSQLPIIEEMSKVTMERQGMYNQGIQRIQTQIDNVAGLDIIRDVDKNYLQSKLSSLGNNLKTVAAGDFSQYQLVNSVGGMVNSIGKDENVQNAVMSTQRVRKALGDRDAANREGKGGLENDMDLDKEINQYLTNSKMGVTFSKGYTPYIDVNKKLFEIGKEVGLDERTAQQLFQTDENGKIKTNKDGVPEFNPVMVEQHLKGKDPIKLLEAFQNSLTPADYNQLAITGRYRKGNSSPEQLKQEILTNYGQNITLANGKIEEVKIELVKELAKPLNTRDKQLIDSLTKQQTYFENQKFNLESSRDQDINTLGTNPDTARANLYTNNYLSGMARSLSSSVVENINKINPQFETNMRVNEFKRQVERDKITDYHWSVEEKRKDREETRTTEKDKYELWFKYGIGEPPKGGGYVNGVDEPINTKDLKYQIVNSIEDGFAKKVDTLNSNNELIALEFFKSSNPKLLGETPKAYDRRLHKKMEDVAIGQGFSLDKKNEFITKFASQQLNDWKQSEEGVPSEFRALLEEQDKLTKHLDVQSIKLKHLNQDAIQQAEDNGLTIPTEAEIKKNIPQTTIQIRDASSGSLKNVTLSAQDLIDFVNLYPEKSNTFGRLSISKNQTRLQEQAKEKLTQKWGKDFPGVETAVYFMDLTNEAMGSKTSPFNTALNFMNNSNYDKLAEIKAQMYIDKGFIKAAKSFPILRNDENQADVNARIATIVSTYPNDKTGYEKSKTADLIALASGNEPNTVKLTATPGLSGEPTTYKMTIYDKKNKEDYPINISAANFSYLSKQSPIVNTEEPDIITQLNEYGTTGSNGTNNVTGAWFNDSDFTNLKEVDITGNLVAQINNPNNLIFKLYIRNKDKSITTLEYDEIIPKYKNGDFNPDLENLAKGITPGLIEYLKNKKK